LWWDAPLLVVLLHWVQLLASMHNCINTEVRFRALLTEGTTEVQLALS